MAVQNELESIDGRSVIIAHTVADNARFYVRGTLVDCGDGLWRVRAEKSYNERCFLSFSYRDVERIYPMGDPEQAIAHRIVFRD